MEFGFYNDAMAVNGDTAVYRPNAASRASLKSEVTSHTDVRISYIIAYVSGNNRQKFEAATESFCRSWLNGAKTPAHTEQPREPQCYS